MTLEEGLKALGFPLPAAAPKLLNVYLNLLEKWNQVYNLTAVRERERMVTHHILDSLVTLPHLAGPTLIDVGTGAGLPGIPLAIARPDWRVSLLDSNHKKTAFLRQVAMELSLTNVTIVESRAEDHKPEEPYQVVISRAYSDLPQFVASAGHLCAPDGVLAAMKGLDPFEELAQLPAAAKLRAKVGLNVPGLDAERLLILLDPVRN